MSQYAVIPIENIIALPDALATPDTWRLEFMGQVWGGFEKIFFSEQDIATIRGAGGDWFDNAQELKDWVLSVSEYKDYKSARDHLKIIIASKGGFEYLTENEKRMAATWFLATIAQIDSVLTFEEKLQAADRFNRGSIASRQERFNAAMVFIWNVFNYIDAIQIQAEVMQENFEYMYIQKGQEGTMMVNYEGISDQPGIFDFILSTPGTKYEALGLAELPITPKYGFTMEQVIEKCMGILRNGNY